MPDKCVQVRVRGKVQGVCFREYTRREAVRLGIFGWVKNCPDGTVEAVLEGESSAVHEMLNRLQTGSPYSTVTGVEVEEKVASHREKEFTILF